MSRLSLILGIVVTGRATELARLMASIEPVSQDPDLHVVVLNNSGAEDPEAAAAVERCVHRWEARSAGARRVIAGGARRLPLHEARRALATAIDSLSIPGSEDPAVWMLDDDLTFESMTLQDDSIQCCNVAVRRIHEARELLTVYPAIDVFVAGFSGDPPIRPEAVLAGQLTDLAEGLRIADCLSDTEEWPSASRAVRRPDDYYDHAELVGAGEFRVPRLWVRRAGSSTTTKAQRAAMLVAARDVPRGCTPFRPLLADPERRVRIVSRANAGGNTLFRSKRTLTAHPWPSWRVGFEWTRRADMIGLAWMAARHGLTIATVSHLSLRHDRTLQSVVDARTERWVPEFTGVLISRAFDSRASRTKGFGQQARQRVKVQLDALRHASDQAAAVQERLLRMQARDAEDRQRLAATAGWVAEVQGVLATLLDGRLADALLAPGVLEVACAAVDELVQGDLS